MKAPFTPIVLSVFLFQTLIFIIIFLLFSSMKISLLMSQLLRPRFSPQHLQMSTPKARSHSQGCIRYHSMPKGFKQTNEKDSLQFMIISSFQRGWKTTLFLTNICSSVTNISFSGQDNLQAIKSMQLGSDTLQWPSTVDKHKQQNA